MSDYTVPIVAHRGPRSGGSDRRWKQAFVLALVAMSAFATPISAAGLDADPLRFAQAAQPPAASPKSPSQPDQTAESPPTPIERPYVVRALVTTRGPDENQIGIGAAAEMHSPLRWGILAGPGVEVDFWQSQNDTAIVSFLPVYWALEYHPVKRFSNAFLSARFGFDLLGQEGDDTLASRNYYALGLGLATRTDRPKALHWELIYSRVRGAFPGVGFSVGYRF